MEESQYYGEAPSVVLMTNDCSWDSGGDGRGKKSGWIRFVRFFVVSKVCEKAKESNLMSNGGNPKDKVGTIMIPFGVVE